MNSIALKTLNTTPVGRTIVHAFSNLNLEKGSYALIPDRKGRTQVLIKTKSAGTDFYRYFKTVNFPFHRIVESNLIPKYAVELNASPAGSESQEYAENALVFHV